ncbi:MAG: tRNA 4-thiouridine(8) synthase ThiI [Candidatus Marinimicrobia bacterium]|nr:tRNA 4-thiouridine(8) synthase ThiI [Candidatus Neomarinimicrobiota bacterium]
MMIPTHILCHYSEIGLKGKNRRYFENKLKDNLSYSLRSACSGCVESVKRLYGRILICLSEKGQKSLNEIEETLTNVFGAAYFALAIETELDLDKIKKSALEVLSKEKFTTFRITARRSNQQFLYSAQKINEEVGAAVVENLGKKVNLSEPEMTCFIDILQDAAYLYLEKIQGPGGLPVGVSGKVVSLISGGIDSPVAAYYLLKRGAQVTFLHFHSVPYTNRASIEKVREVVRVLNKFQMKGKLILAELAPIQREIMTATDQKFRVILYRRFMFRIAEAIAKKVRATAIITGESLGQVASQTLENMGVIEEVTKLPVLRPLVGMDKQEIINRAITIGTYDISIQPEQDCCSLFVPKHPATKASLEAVLLNEKNLNIKELVKNSLETSVEELIIR